MAMTGGKSVISSKATKLFHITKSRQANRSTSAKAKKIDGSSENSTAKKKPIFPITFSTKFLAQSAITVFGLGFIDAGYSGDWSRIGAITKESEDLLKVSAFLVVPICLFLVIYLAKSEELSS